MSGNQITNTIEINVNDNSTKFTNHKVRWFRRKNGNKNPSLFTEMVLHHCILINFIPNKQNRV